MSGLFRKNLGQTEPALGDLDLQTSAFGMTIPATYGRYRLPINLLWYGDFKATAQEERQEAGKGGSTPSRTFYVYSASVILGVSEGPVAGVRRVWKGKQRFDAVEAGNAARALTEKFVLPQSSPYTATVSANADWLYTDSVVAEGTNDGNWEVEETLRDTIDYTVSAAGVYTFAAKWAGRRVQIRYVRKEATAAASALESLGMTLVPNGGTIWPHLSANHPTEAIPYAGLAYIRAQDYPLSDYAQVENHNIEVDGRLQYSSVNPDCLPIDVIEDILQNPTYGAGWPASMLGDSSHYGEQCVNLGYFISMAYMAQAPVRDRINEILEATQGRAVWDGRQLTFIPIWDDANGSYTPNTTPVFDFGPDDFGPEGVKWERTGDAEVDNNIPVEYTERGADYQTQVVTWRNEAAELAYGRKTGSAKSYRFFCQAQSANMAAAAIGHMQSAQSTRFKWRVPVHYLEFLPGDLVTLTDPLRGLARTTVMVESMSESDGWFNCEGFSFPIGTANAPVVPPAIGSGFIPNWNEVPGAVTTPRFIEPPGGFVTNGLEVWAAVSGGAQWGGCDIYASLDGSSYKQVGTINEGVRYGAVTAVAGSGVSMVITVALTGKGGLLRSVSADDAAAGRSLCFIGDTTDGEYITYQTATLVGINTYQLSGLRRGLHGTKSVTPSVSAAFVYVDQSLATSGPLDVDMVGKQVHFKFVSFNRYGGGLESLATVTDYTYTVTGRFMDQKGLPYVNNKLRNPGFEYNVADWTFIPAPQIAAGSKFFLDPVNRVQGSPSNATMYQPSKATNLTVPQTLESTVLTLNNLRDYIAFAKFLPVNCTARLTLRYLSANGGIVGSFGFSNQILAMADSNDPQDYGLAVLRADPPDDARYGQLIVWKGNSIADGASWVRIFEPFLGEGVKGQPGLPVWNNGGQQTIDAAQIATDAVERVYKVPTNPIAPVTVTSTAWKEIIPAVLPVLPDGGIGLPAEDLFGEFTADCSVTQGASTGEIGVEFRFQAGIKFITVTGASAHSIGNGNSVRGSASASAAFGPRGSGIMTYGVYARLIGAASTATVNSCNIIMRSKRR